MTNRVTPEDLKAIFPTDLSKTDLQPWIDDANLFVTEVLGTSGLSAGMLTTIEKYISAHLASAVDPRVRKESNLQVEYEGPGLRDTWYGRRAILMDTTNTLSNLDTEKGFGLLFRAARGVDVDEEFVAT